MDHTRLRTPHEQTDSQNLRRYANANPNFNVLPPERATRATMAEGHHANRTVAVVAAAEATEAAAANATTMATAIDADRTYAEQEEVEDHPTTRMTETTMMTIVSTHKVERAMQLQVREPRRTTRWRYLRSPRAQRT